MRLDHPLSFTPLYHSRVWGGTALADRLGRILPPGGPYGESWDLVDRPEAQSVVDFGPWAGTSLHQLWVEHREAVFGSGLKNAERFPLLIKILDAREVLSVQVHPPWGVAVAAAGEPKTEAWVILEASPEAKVYAGFRRGVTREIFEEELRKGNVESLLHSISVKSGDVLFIPSGRCHAIGAGCLIAEVQQNSDTTYRVFDWGRVGLDGKPRELHVMESLECMRFDDIEPELVKPEGESLIKCPFFEISRRRLRGAGSEKSAVQQGAIYLVESGSVECGGRIFSRGSTFLTPAGAGALDISSVGEDAVLMCSAIGVEG